MMIRESQIIINRQIQLVMFTNICCEFRLKKYYRLKLNFIGFENSFAVLNPNNKLKLDILDLL